MARNMVYPEGYSATLSVRDTQKAVGETKTIFSEKLSAALNLTGIPAPLAVTKASGINDDLNGVERKVHFTMKEVEGTAEIVQSLAKWKRMALGKYGYNVGEGIWTDMKAIRRDDDTDNLHSLFVDQWDWEKVISADMRNFDYLKETVRAIVGALADTNDAIKASYPALDCKIDREVFLITTQELEDMYPTLTTKERENEITKLHRSVFLMQIGDVLKSGIKHDGRAPDYDDWALNGDILIRNDVLGCAFEISSMGIRVDKKSLSEQLVKANATERKDFPFHKGILEETLPLSIGGGIGQSRLCMLLLQKAHIGEVQVSVWPDDMRAECKAHNIELL